MGAVPNDYVLRDFQRAGPVLWVSKPRELPQIPDVSDATLNEIFDTKRSRSIKSWAHDERGIHWLVTRSGLPLHDDIGYTRYTHQLIIRNDGWRIAGQDEQLDLPPLMTGVLNCLDTWSPHKVVRDERFRDSKKALYKAMLVVDRDEPLSEDEAWELLSSRLSDPSCAVGLEELRSRTRAPGFDPKKVAAIRAELLGNPSEAKPAEAPAAAAAAVAKRTLPPTERDLRKARESLGSGATDEEVNELAASYVTTRLEARAKPKQLVAAG